MRPILSLNIFLILAGFHIPKDICAEENYDNSGPVVWSEPQFPTVSDDITLFFDASAGNGALSGFAGDVYAHMGVITDRSTSETDWKYVIGNWGTADSRTKMTKDTGDIYSINYNIKAHHKIPDGEKVLKLAFVFRNESGSIVGRDTDGSDIFLDVFQSEDGLFFNVNSPNEEGVYLVSDSLPIQIDLSDSAQTSIKLDSNVIFEKFTNEIDTQIYFEQTGNYELRFEASNGEDTVMKNIRFIVIDQFSSIKNPPANFENGLNYFTDSTYIFQLTAPNKKHVFLLTFRNEFSPQADFQMHQDSTGEVFWIELENSVFEDNQCAYQYLVDGEIRIADPYSMVILDPNLDFEIRPEVMSELPIYPENQTQGFVTVFDYWPDSTHVIMLSEKPRIKELTVYEILLRDFLEDHSFPSLMDTLDYLQALGVNAIELMPVNEFEGNQSWGYNPSFHMALDKYYGSRSEFKKFINAAHAKGIAVILDVVFNHAFSQSPLAQLYWDPAAFRPSPDNPWLNVTARHPFNVGYDFNHEYSGTKQWVKQICSYWLEEFKVDGFRFDLSKGLTQKNSGNDAGLMSQYDQSRIDILKDYADHIWSVDSSAYVIMEHFADNSEEKVLADYGMMLWGNMNHDFSQTAQGFAQNLNWANYRFRDWSDPHLVAYMESHDEERMMYSILKNGDREGDYNTRKLETALQRVAGASTIYYTLPGPKMIWQFGELGYDFSINYCVSGVVDGCRLDPKPIRWDYIQNESREMLFDVTSDLLYLRKNYPVFTSLNFEFDDRFLNTKSVKLFHEDMDAMSLVNFRIKSANIIPYFPYEGTWYEYFSGDSIIVTDLDERISMGPGEYRIYTTKKIDRPGGVTTSVQNQNFVQSELFPNPANQRIYISLNEVVEVQLIEIMDIHGKSIISNWSVFDKTITIDLNKHMAPGIYAVKIHGKNKLASAKVVIAGQ